MKIKLSKSARKKLEKMLEEETKDMPLPIIKKYLLEVADYLLNICPKHYKINCEECLECKYGKSKKNVKTERI